MKIDLVAKVLLLVITVSSGAIALPLYWAPPAVQAQSGAAGPVYVEPGTFMLRAPHGSRSVMGKVVVDLRTGHVWGFQRCSRILILPQASIPTPLFRTRS